MAAPRLNAQAPIYTSENCRAAFQLNWSLALFWHEPTVDANWLGDLQRAVGPDGVRILTHQFAEPAVSQFLVSTRPDTAPERLVWSERSLRPAWRAKDIIDRGRGLARCLASFAINNPPPAGQIDRSRPFRTVTIERDNGHNASRQGTSKQL
jgi:hypothetical protein